MKNKTIRVKNFRVFNDTTEIEFAPITILTGTNSSGKSSVLKTLLLFKENSQKQFPLFENLDFTSENMGLGNFEDSLNRNTKENFIKFSFDYNFREFFHIDKNKMIIDFYYYLDGKNELKSAELRKLELRQGNKSLLTYFKIDNVWSYRYDLNYFHNTFLEYYNKITKIIENEEKEMMYISIKDKEKILNILNSPVLNFNIFANYENIISYEKNEMLNLNYGNITKDIEILNATKYTSHIRMFFYMKLLINYRTTLEKLIQKEFNIDKIEEFSQLLLSHEKRIFNDYYFMFYIFYYNDIDFPFDTLYEKIDDILDSKQEKYIKYYIEHVKIDNSVDLSLDEVKKIENQKRIAFEKKEIDENFLYKKIKKVLAIKELFKDDENEKKKVKSSIENIEFLKKHFEIEKEAIEMIKKIKDEIIFKYIEDNNDDYINKIHKNTKEKEKSLGNMFDTVISFLESGERENETIIDLINESFIKNLKESLSFLKDFEYMEAVRAKSKRIYTFNSQDTSFNELIKEFEKIELEDEHINFLKKWLKNFDIDENFEIKMDNSSTGVYIKFGDDYLSELGYGVTQFFPILLKIIVTSTKNIRFSDEIMAEIRYTTYLYIEEPETNLHPKLQSLLADMFYDARKVFNIYFILETHSEYLVRKLQLLTAKKEIKPEDTAIYYFNNPKNIPKDEKQIKRLYIDESGFMNDDFGTGFFDEASKLITDIWKIDNRN